MALLDAQLDNSFGEDISVVMNYKIYRDYIDTDATFLSTENQLIHVLKGSCKIKVNLEEYYLHAGQIMTTPKRSFIRNMYWDKDLEMQTIAFRDDAPILSGLMPYYVSVVSLQPDEDEAVRHFFSLISHLSKMRSLTSPDMMHFISPLLFFLCKTHQQANMVALTRPEQIRNQFLIDLQTKFDAREHNIGYYASLQNISPNSLSAAISKTSSHSASDFLNLKFMVEIEAMMQNPANSVEDIVRELHFNSHSQFAHFFKRQNGMTFSEYRRKRYGIS